MSYPKISAVVCYHCVKELESLCHSFNIQQVMDATFDHILPLAQSRMPASFGTVVLYDNEGYTYITGNLVDMVIKDCLDLNIAEQLC